MQLDVNEITVRHEPAAQRFAAQAGGETAVLEYERAGQTLILTHTGVPPALEGHGLANKLAQAALEYARAAHCTVVPRCPFVASYVAKHSEYQALIVDEPPA